VEARSFVSAPGVFNGLVNVPDERARVPVEEGIWRKSERLACQAFDGKENSNKFQQPYHGT
jgi:hypothetical protein